MGTIFKLKTGKEIFETLVFICLCVRDVGYSVGRSQLVVFLLTFPCVGIIYVNYYVFF